MGTPDTGAEQDIYAGISAHVQLVCAELSDLELATLNNCVQADFNPHGRLFPYEKVKTLFTEGDGTRMHQTTKEALASVVLKRLGG